MADEITFHGTPSPASALLLAQLHGALCVLHSDTSADHYDGPDCWCQPLIVDFGDESEAPDI